MHSTRVYILSIFPSGHLVIVCIVLHIPTMDYASTYLEFLILDKIHNEPTFETLKGMKKQLKANALSVPSTLGGGNHGLLGLVLTQVEYARVSNDAFTIPNQPGPLILPPFTAKHDVHRLQGEHEQEVDTYKECVAVQKM